MLDNFKLETRKSKISPIQATTIRFAGDSGDGIQLSGDRLAMVSTAMGNEVITIASFPAEIRSPAGTVEGVSSYQLHISSAPAYSPGDKVDVLVALNPAALKVDRAKLKPHGVLIVNEDSFKKTNWTKAGYSKNPLCDTLLESIQVLKVPITSLTCAALAEYSSLKRPEMVRSKNFFALGLICWLLDRKLEILINWINKKFDKHSVLATVNQIALNAGYNYGEMTELAVSRIAIAKSEYRTEGCKYRYINGNEALAVGLVVATEKSDLPLFFGSYPITPASNILHELCKHDHYKITTFQAEDEIAAIGAALGASYGGAIGVTATSGPGMALSSEFINLAVMAELPLVVIDVQRAGPSTGMPTKTEQSDLMMALYGRHGESPAVVISPCSPANCFNVAIEACRIALKYMVPVIILSDAYLANSSESWRVPDVDEIEPIIPSPMVVDSQDFSPYMRNKVTLARPWIKLGTKDFEHCIGGLEKDAKTGAISYDGENHQTMVKLRADKVEKVSDEIPLTEIFGQKEAPFLIVGWGSSYGAIRNAVVSSLQNRTPIAAVHLRFLNPFPSDLMGILNSYKIVLVIENNSGQLASLLKAKGLSAEVKTFYKIDGSPFEQSEIEAFIRRSQEFV